MKSRINLKPCPFCGGRVEIVIGLLKGLTMIECKRCRSLTSFQNNETADKAAEMWNRRVQK